MHVTQYAAGEGSDEECHRLVRAVLTHDLPGDPPPELPDVSAAVRQPPPGCALRLWSARSADGDLVGLASVRTSERTNVRTGRVTVHVHPDHRRRGAGTRLLAEAVRALHGDGRDVLRADTLDGGDGVWFATARGLREALREARSLLDVATADSELLDKIAEEEHASYRLAAWVDGAPDDLLASYAVARRAMTDAPVGTLAHQAPDFDSASMREHEAWMRSLGREYRVIVALHEPTGDVAGLTEVMIPHHSPSRAVHGDTAVLPAHRGQGLGLWMKAEMLRWLRANRPDVVELCASNAESNVTIRRINELLGYRFDRWLYRFQAEVATLARRFGE